MINSFKRNVDFLKSILQEKEKEIESVVWKNYFTLVKIKSMPSVNSR